MMSSCVGVVDLSLVDLIRSEHYEWSDSSVGVDLTKPTAPSRTVNFTIFYPTNQSLPQGSSRKMKNYGYFQSILDSISDRQFSGFLLQNLRDAFPILFSFTPLAYLVHLFLLLFSPLFYFLLSRIVLSKSYSNLLPHLAPSSQYSVTFLSHGYGSLPSFHYKMAQNLCLNYNTVVVVINYFGASLISKNSFNQVKSVLGIPSLKVWERLNQKQSFDLSNTHLTIYQQDVEFVLEYLKSQSHDGNGMKKTKLINRFQVVSPKISTTVVNLIKPHLDFTSMQFIGHSLGGAISIAAAQNIEKKFLLNNPSQNCQFNVFILDPWMHCLPLSSIETGLKSSRLCVIYCDKFCKSHHPAGKDNIMLVEKLLDATPNSTYEKLTATTHISFSEITLFVPLFISRLLRWHSTKNKNYSPHNFHREIFNKYQQFYCHSNQTSKFDTGFDQLKNDLYQLQNDEMDRIKEEI